MGRCRVDGSPTKETHLRVLHTIATLDLRAGGPSVALAGLAVAQAQAGIEVSIVTSWRNGDEPESADSLRRSGIRVESIGPGSGPLLRHPKLAPLIRDNVARSDVVHIHGIWEEITHQAAVASRGRGIPYIIRPCGMLDPWSLQQSRWKKRLYMAWRLRTNLNRAAAIHFTTSVERDLVAPLRLKAPTIVEPNGIDLTEFANAPPPGSFRARFPFTQGRRLILFMGRLHHKKGFDLLIPAMAKLRNQDAVLAIAGPDSGAYRQTLETMIANANLKERVLFTGMLWREERIAAVADADLFVLPSYQENFGIAVIEALAAGTPVVISDQVNLCPEVLAAGVGGVVPLDVDRLAAEMDRWLGDETMLRAAGEKARAFALDRFAWGKIAQRWVGHYAQMAGYSLTNRSLQ
jgi:glycosyltransferase involved in cell wall biosynthesis